MVDIAIFSQQGYGLKVTVPETERGFTASAVTCAFLCVSTCVLQESVRVRKEIERQGTLK